MYLINKEKDNIISIVKSLHPIKYLYSKQNKDYDKFFRGANLKDFVQKMNSQKKSNDYVAPGENLDEYDNKNADTNIIFKKGFNYFEELSNLKKIPFTFLKKKNTKTTRYNSENSKQNQKDQNKKSKEKNKKKLVLIKNKGDIDVTLDPGRYNPNYDYIKRRYPCAYLGKPKNEDDYYNNTEKEKEEGNKTEKYKNTSDITDENYSSTKNNRNANIKGETKNKKLLYTPYSNKTMEDKPNIRLKYKKINFRMNSDIKKIKKVENNKTKLDSQSNKKTTTSTFKLLNTVSSWTKANFFSTTKRDKNKSVKHSKSQLYNTQRFFRNKKIELTKKSSSDNLRCPIIFNKMPGRDRPVLFMKGVKEANRVGYNPNYNFLRPHIPSTIFSSQKKLEEIKKFMTYKIIRSYYYNPGEYFVLDFNQSKDKEIKEKYRSLLLRI